MKRIGTFLLAALMLFAALPALALPTEREELTFDIYTGENNQVLYIERLDIKTTGLAMAIENEKNTKILSKNKVNPKTMDGYQWVSMLVSPKKTGSCSYTVLYDYTDPLGNFWEYSRVIHINISDPPAPPKITKNPSAETIAEGDGCTFVARADDADSIMWFLTNGHDTIKASKGPSRFAGLRVSGTDTEKLKLTNVPTSLDGWEAFATFKNENGASDSKSADISVYKELTRVTEMPYTVYVTPTPAPDVPSVSVSASAQDPYTGACTLTATLSGCDSYVCQWYYNTKNGVSGAVPVGGNDLVTGRRTSFTASFDGKTEPAYYWFVKVWNPEGGMPVYSQAVRMENPFLQNNAPAATARPRVTPAPVNNGPDPAPTPYNGTKLRASGIEIQNAAGRAVGLAEQEAKRVTGFADGTYVLIDETLSTLWYTNAYGTYTAAIAAVPAKTLMPDGSKVRKGTEPDELLNIYALTWTETPKVLSDHTVTASSIAILESYGFPAEAKLSFGLDGREQTQAFDAADHASGWRYTVAGTFDIPIA